jgi:hypothetical protein
LDLQDEKVKQQLAKAGYKIWNLLWAKHGTVNVRWIMTNSLTGETVTHTERLEIPDSDLTLSKPFFPAVNFDWLVWPKLQASQSRRGYQIQYPYRIGADFFLPELTPKIKKERAPVCYFKIYNLLPESKNPPIAFALVDEKGQMAQISQFGLKQEPKFLEHGGMETFWKIVALPNVTPGSYRFRVDMTDTVRRKEVIRDVTLDVL